MSAEIKTAEVHPVVPKVGALIRVKSDGTLVNFQSWKDDKTIVVHGDRAFDIDEVEALTPAHYGLIHERACAMPSSGHAGRIVAVRSWRNLNPIVCVEGETRVQTWTANTVAGLCPLLNPATESVEDKAARLEREYEALTQGLHARMVAEGVARSWCNEFDGILDATGLPPRQKKNVVEGIMRFRTTLSYDPKDESIMTAIKARPFDYIPTRDLSIVEISTPDFEAGPMLS